MPTGALPGYGTILKKGSTPIAEVTSITGIGVNREVVDVTNLSSTDGWKEFIPTLLEFTEITLNINFIPSNSTQSFTAGLGKDLVDGTLDSFTLSFPDASTNWSFSAYVTKFAVTAAVAGALTATITLKPSGKPTLA